MISLIFEDENIFDISSMFLTQSKPIVVGIEGYKDLTSAVKIKDVGGNDFLVIIFNAAADDVHIVCKNCRIGCRTIKVVGIQQLRIGSLFKLH